MIDELRFERARVTVLGESYEKDGIGTYSEKALHRILKLYFEENEAFHEVKFLGSVADVKNEKQIYEIQTRAFGKLSGKLEKFLTEMPVTVVYPLPYEKYVRWIDRETGEISQRRKSPKKSSVFDSFYELYNIREFLSNKNLSVKLVFLNVEEFKYIGGKVIGRERKSVRAERIPISIERIVELNDREDYKIFFPKCLGDSFTAADFNRSVGKRFKYGYSGIAILKSLGLVSEGERVGRKIIYKRLP